MFLETYYHNLVSNMCDRMSVLGISNLECTSKHWKKSCQIFWVTGAVPQLQVGWIEPQDLLTKIKRNGMRANCPFRGVYISSTLQKNLVYNMGASERSANSNIHNHSTDPLVMVFRPKSPNLRCRHSGLTFQQSWTDTSATDVKSSGPTTVWVIRRWWCAFCFCCPRHCSARCYSVATATGPWCHPLLGRGVVVP